MDPIIRLIVLLAPAIWMLDAAAESFPGPRLDEEYASQMAAADAAFYAGEFETAFSIYLNDLAPKGDKFAQHQVGVMLIGGLGTAPDLPLGAAWLDLSSQRGDLSLREYRNEVWDRLSGDSRSAARDELEVLEQSYGDCAIIRVMVEEDRDALESLTGSRLENSDILPISMMYGDRTSEAIGNDPIWEHRHYKSRLTYLRDHCNKLSP